VKIKGKRDEKPLLLFGWREKGAMKIKKNLFSLGLDT